MKKTVIGLLMAAVSLAIMAYVENVIAPVYLIKSACKLILFCLPVIIYACMSNQSIKEVIGLNKMKPARWLYLGMVLAYVGIIAVFLIVREQLDLENIRTSLINKEQLTRENCLFVFAYIIVVNSFLEESFFRGFIYQLFEKQGNGKTGMIVSAICFALYHIGMVSNWFNPLIFVLCITGLALCGVILQIVCLKFGSLKASWLIHGCANLAINTIGVILIFQL
ncbi:MAG: CPBP family intramembrane metalloprotease [Erysipelotrichaceae bacterium]|nr:CPBP family intramembrane metalloprotease [Erysipelotrichaceae bacterium]